jgi:DNA recombination protein RmuC
LTLGHKLELIKADVQAQQLSEQAEAVLEELEVLGERFDEVNDEWDTLYRHLRNAKNKADDVDDAHDRLRAEFDRIDQPSLEGGDARSGGD